MKDQDKIKKAVLDYFKLVNTLPYKDLNLKFDDKRKLFVITIHCHSLVDANEYYCSDRKGTVTSKYTREMEEMFPYSFHVCAHYNRVFN